MTRPIARAMTKHRLSLLAIAMILWLCPLQARAELPLFLTLARDALFLPPAMLEKFANDPIVRAYQEQYQQKKLRPNLGAVPPRPTHMSKRDAQEVQKNLQQERDQLWRTTSSASEPKDALGANDIKADKLADENETMSSEGRELSDKHKEWMPNLLGNRANNGRNSNDNGRDINAPIGMAIAKPSNPYTVNSPYFDPQAIGAESLTEGQFLPTTPPMSQPNSPSIKTPDPLPGSAALKDAGAGEKTPLPAPATNQAKTLAKNLENSLPDKDFLAATPPRSAKIAPPTPRDQSQTAKTADNAQPIKLAILVFAEGSETLPENSLSVLQKLAAYQKQEQIILSLTVEEGKKSRVTTARLAAIRAQLVALGVAPDMIRADTRATARREKPLQNPPNQIIIFGVPKTSSQKPS